MGEKNKETNKVVTNEQGEGRKDREKERESKKKTDGNQAVGEFCLDKAGERTPVTLRKPQSSLDGHQGLLGSSSMSPLLQMLGSSREP